MTKRPPMLGVEATQRSAAEVAAIVIDAVADHFGLTAADLLGKRRNACFASARQMAVYLSQELTGETNGVLGTLFGLDPSTVSFAGLKLARQEKEMPKVAASLAAIRQALREIDPGIADRPPRATEARRRFLENTGAEAITVSELELHLLLKDLRRSLLAALRTDPGALLGGLRRTCEEINSQAARP